MYQVECKEHSLIFFELPSNSHEPSFMDEERQNDLLEGTHLISGKWQ